MFFNLRIQKKFIRKSTLEERVNFGKITNYPRCEFFSQLAGKKIPTHAKPKISFTCFARNYFFLYFIFFKKINRRFFLYFSERKGTTSRLSSSRIPKEY